MSIAYASYDEGFLMARRKRADMIDETRGKLIVAARKAFAEKGFADASMDDLTAEAGLTRGALYHHFGDKKGLLAAVVTLVDSEMAERAHQVALHSGADTPWDQLLVEGIAYIELALDPEIQRIVLLDGPAYLGDPSRWPSQNSCLEATKAKLTALIEAGTVKQMDCEAAARLVNGAALNAALWVASSDRPKEVLPKAQHALRELMSGLLKL